MNGIAFLKGIDPVEFVEIPSEQTVAFVQNYLSTPELLERKKLLRKSLNITQSLQEFLVPGENLLDHPAFNDNVIGQYIFAMSQISLEKHNVGSEWQIQFVLLQLFDACIDFEYFQARIDSKFEFLVGKKNIASRMFDYPREVGAILVPYQSNKQQFKDWIDENWELMEKEMDQTLEEYTPFTKTYKNVELGREIDTLKKIGKTYDQIAEYFTDKYPEDQRLMDTNIVKTMHHRHLQLIEKLQKQLPSIFID